MIRLQWMAKKPLLAMAFAASGPAWGSGQVTSKVSPADDCLNAAVPAICLRNLQFETHCNSASEDVIFSCSTGKNTVSVCASRIRTPTQGYVQYRFGPPRMAQFVFPQPAAHPGQFVRGGHLMYGGGSGTYMRLFNGKFAYVVYDGYAPGWEKAGVAVEKDGKLLSDLPCAQSRDPNSILGKYRLFEEFGIPKDKAQAQFVVP